MWLRLRQLDRISKSLLNSLNGCKAAVLANTMDEQARNSLSVVSLMGDLKKVYRFKDVRQVSIDAMRGPNMMPGSQSPFLARTHYGSNQLCSLRLLFTV